MQIRNKVYTGIRLKCRGIRGKERGTVTTVPVDSRTTVQGVTQEGLTSGFGMGPGKLHRYDRAPNSFRFGYWKQRYALLRIYIGMISSMKGTRLCECNM